MNEYKWLQNAAKRENSRGDTLEEICSELGIDTSGVGVDRAVQGVSEGHGADAVARVDAAWDILDAAVSRAIGLDRNTIAAFRVAGVSGKRFLGQATITSITMVDDINGPIPGYPGLAFDTEQGESFSGNITDFHFE
jgi:hypothetical protein